MKRRGLRPLISGIPKEKGGANSGVLVQDLMFLIGNTCTPKVGKIMAFMAIVMGLGLLSYILLGGLGYLEKKQNRLAFFCQPKALPSILGGPPTP